MEKPFECPICYTCYKESAELGLHMQVHQGDNGLHNCSICGEEFDQVDDLVMHIKCHVERKGTLTVNAQTRGKTAGEASRRNEFPHAEEEHFTCGVCMQEFGTEEGLVKHMEIHLDGSHAEGLERPVSGEEEKLRVREHQEVSAYSDYKTRHSGERNAMSTITNAIGYGSTKECIERRDVGASGSLVHSIIKSEEGNYEQGLDFSLRPSKRIPVGEGGYSKSLGMKDDRIENGSMASTDEVSHCEKGRDSPNDVKGRGKHKILDSVTNSGNSQSVDPKRFKLSAPNESGEEKGDNDSDSDKTEDFDYDDTQVSHHNEMKHTDSADHAELLGSDGYKIYDNFRDDDNTAVDLSLKTSGSLDGAQSIVGGDSDKTTWPQTTLSRKYADFTVVQKLDYDRTRFYACAGCDISYMTPDELKVHMRSHDKKERFYQCTLCQMTFCCCSNLVSHLRTHTGERPFVCAVCDKSFAKNSTLTRHVKCHTGEKNHVCEVCNKAFIQKCQLGVHMKVHRNHQPHECPLCPKKFVNREQLESHMVKHEIQRHICDACGREFNEKRLLRRHLKVHLKYPGQILRKGRGGKPKPLAKSSEEAKIHPCDECGAILQSRNALRTHMKRHTGERPFQCSICPWNFSIKSNLLSHMMTHTKEKPHKCPVCSKGFTKNQDVKRHMKTHTGERPFQCTVCGKAFGQKCVLTTHMKIHTKEKPFTCPNCDRRFTLKSQLQSHSLIHQENRDHTCQECGKVFREAGTLSNHMRIHTGEKPYSCPICGKSFHQEGYMQKHIKTHRLGKPCKCLICFSTFVTDITLLRHMRKSHIMENPFKCLACNWEFDTDSLLKEHMTIHYIDEARSTVLSSQKNLEDSMTSLTLAPSASTLSSNPQNFAAGSPDQTSSSTSSQEMQTNLSLPVDSQQFKEALAVASSSYIPADFDQKKDATSQPIFPNMSHFPPQVGWPTEPPSLSSVFGKEFKPNN